MRHLVDLTMLPSDYFRRQCFISCDPDETAAPLIIDHVGSDCFLWATDYPHPDHPANWRAVAPALRRTAQRRDRGARRRAATPSACTGSARPDPLDHAPRSRAVDRAVTERATAAKASSSLTMSDPAGAYMISVTPGGGERDEPRPDGRAIAGEARAQDRGAAGIEQRAVAIGDGDQMTFVHREMPLPFGTGGLDACLPGRTAGEPREPSRSPTPTLRDSRSRTTDRRRRGHARWCGPRRRRARCRRATWRRSTSCRPPGAAWRRPRRRRRRAPLRSPSGPWVRRAAARRSVAEGRNPASAASGRPHPRR